MDLTVSTNFKNEEFSKEGIQDSIEHILLQIGCSLNLVNNYRENIIHLCASNNCNNLIESILRKYGTEKADSKNKFGWTPLMHALRERHLDTVQLLINSGFHPFHRSYLGMSTLGIAAAASLEAFECIFARYPIAISNTATDDISPLCIAAMKNDKKLFFRILELGVPIHTASEYTHFMMRRCKHAEIQKLAKTRLSVEDFWEKNDDNIKVNSATEILIDFEHPDFIKPDKNMNIPNIKIHHSLESKQENEFKYNPSNLHQLHIDVKNEYFSEETMFSPNLKYNQTDSFCMSPNVCFKLCTESSTEQKRKINNSLQYSSDTASSNSTGHTTHRTNNAQDELNKRYSVDSTSFVMPVDIKTVLREREFPINVSTKRSKLCKPNIHNSPASPIKSLSKKYEKIRPPNLNLGKQRKENDILPDDDLNKTLGFTPEFTPGKSPYALEDSDDENAYGEKTPTPPRCSTPPTGIVLTSSQNKLIRLLQAHELDHHIPLFLQQEVDIDLFVTLEDDDLFEIGIQNERERVELLQIIKNIEMRRYELSLI